MPPRPFISHVTGRLRLAVATVVALAAATLPLGSALAQSSQGTMVEQHLGNVESAAQEQRFGLRNGSFIAAPIPFNSPMIGAGLILGGGYVFQNSAQTRSSNFGLGGFRSENGSNGYGVAANLALRDNSWLIKLFYGQADVYYDLYTSLGPLPIEQTGTLGRIAVSRGLSERFSVGATLRYLETEITPTAGVLPPALRPTADLELANIGLVAEWDGRDDNTYPTRGTRIQAEATQGHSLGRIALDYTKAYANLDAFFPVTDTSVLATRLSVCGVSGAAPFFDKCSIGFNDAFRGFNSTRYIGERSVSAQVEFRQRLGKRLGVVVFAGAGVTGSSFGTLEQGGVHSAGGAGLRYRVSKKFPVDFSVDLARNDLGGELLYVYVGQRF